MTIREAAQEAIRKAKQREEPVYMVHHLNDPADPYDPGHYHFEDEDTIQTTDDVATAIVTTDGQIH